ncbi:hypothetical protein RJ641_026289 [Dillenia turbinata]|uniref:Uncharacterized protein n=1 Tax=Dillenia turbinata TaxID=194707 RepID=A0AAN8WBC1_9MAGN
MVQASRRECLLVEQVRQKLQEQGFKEESITSETYLNLRYEGTDTSIMAKRQNAKDDYAVEFVKLFEQEYGLSYIKYPKRPGLLQGLFKLENLSYGDILPRPGNSTVIVEPNCKAIITKYGNIKIEIDSTLCTVKTAEKGCRCCATLNLRPQV